MRDLSPIEPDPVIELYKSQLDHSLIRESLRLTPEQRIDRLQAMVRFAEELHAAGKRLRAAGR